MTQFHTANSASAMIILDCLGANSRQISLGILCQRSDISIGSHYPSPCLCLSRWFLTQFLCPLRFCGQDVGSHMPHPCVHTYSTETCNILPRVVRATPVASESKSLSFNSHRPGVWARTFCCKSLTREQVDSFCFSNRAQVDLQVIKMGVFFVKARLYLTCCWSFFALWHGNVFIRLRKDREQREVPGAGFGDFGNTSRWKKNVTLNASLLKSNEEGQGREPVGRP